MTIFALSSGAGRAGIAVIRVSGPAAGVALTALAGLRRPPPPRQAERVRLRSCAGETIDEALCLWFPAPNSFTGEDVVEFHVHGGGAVVARVLGELSTRPGLRLAEAGEFTRRAFDNGKLDLTQVEGLADLIDAETEAQRKQAQRALDGDMGELYGGWAKRLTRMLAHIETAIDFAEDTESSEIRSAMQSEIQALVDEIGRHLGGYGGAKLVREGIHVVIVGPPNVGKSSLFNRLAGRDAAIVAEQAGTTRDVVEAALDLGGQRVWLSDTAGVRVASGAVEREGVRRALSAGENADLRILVSDAGCVAPKEVNGDGSDERTLAVANKIDLVGEPRGARVADGSAVWEVSALTGAGMNEFRAELERRIVRLGGYGGVPIIRDRHREGLAACASALGRCLGTREIELQAEDLRLALRSLGRITGSVDVEDLLDVIFRDFCIGK